jgi:hypothetical protein
MNPPGKTTLSRMQRAAMIEAERIEISQDARVRFGDLKEPMPDQVNLRDDFAGMVRLIDAIESDARLKDLIGERLAQLKRARVVAPAQPAAEFEVEAE